MFSEIVEKLPADLADFCPGAPIDDRHAWNAVPQHLRRLVNADAQAAVSRPWPMMRASDYRDYCLTGNRARFEAMYFGRRRMLNDLVLAELLEDEGRFLPAIVDGIFLICEESGWQLPAHNAYQRGGQRLDLPDVDQPVVDLFAAETGALLAVVVSLIGKRLDDVSPLIVSRIEREVQVRILSPYLDRHFWWMGNGAERMNNWTAWITQNVLLATFCLKTGQQLRRRIAAKALVSLDAFVKDYAEDGACEEGVNYYRHAALCMHGSMTILDHVANGAMRPLWRTAKIRNMAEYIANMHVDGCRYFNFADSAAVIEPCTSREYGFGKAVGSDVLCNLAIENRRLATAPQLPEEWNLWYRVEELLSAAHLDQQAKNPGSRRVVSPPNIFYPGIGLFVARDDRFALAVKGGNNGESHNHNDVGSLTLYKHGAPLLIDVGVETYTAKTFSPQRYEIWTMQSGFHNLPSFGDVMQSDGAAFAARDVETELGADRARISLDIAPAYPPEARLRSYRRTVELSKGRVEITDVHDGDLPAVLSLMTAVLPVSRPGGLHFAGLTEIDIDGAGSIAVEAIEIKDERLRQSWPSTLYRVRIPFAGKRLTLRIV